MDGTVNDRCEGCDLAHLPVCEGQHHRNFCDPSRQALRHKRSLFRASLEHGWPGRSSRPATPRARLARRLGGIRVGLVTPGLLLGGAERWVVSLIEATDAAPFHWQGVAVLHPQHAPPANVAVVEQTCPVTVGQAALASLAAQVDILVAWGIPDVHSLLGNASCRTILVSHGICDWTARAVRDAAQATALAAVAKAAVRPFPADQQARVQVIYNTATTRPVTITRAAQRAAWGLPEGAKVLGFLGRVSSEKYPEAIVKAIAELPREWYGVIVGPNPHNVQYLVDQLGVHDRIRLPGPTDEPGNALAAFDTMLLPSFGEGCSIVLIEAWHARIPCIATPVGLAEEYPELVRTVPIGADGPTIAAAVLDDQADADGVADRVDRAQAFAQQSLTFERFRDDWRAMFMSVMPKPKAEKPRVPLGCGPCHGKRAGQNKPA